MPLTLADRLTEYLDRAVYVYRWPLYPPPKTQNPERPRSCKAPDWMDAEPYERWHPDRVRITPDRLVLLGAKRREILNQHLAHLEAHGRTPRVCLYTLNPVGEQPARSFAAARAHTDGKGWRVGAYRCMAEARSILTSDDEPTPLQKAVSAVRSVLRAPQRT